MFGLLKRISKKTVGKGDQRDFPRIHLPEGEIVLVSDKEGPVYQVENISCRGIALAADSFKIVPDRGHKIVGTIKLGSDNVPVEATVKHAEGKIIGCSFVDSNHVLENQLEKIFLKELNAHKLIKIHPELLTPVNEGIPFYFYGGHKDELYFINKGSSVDSFHMIFGDQYIEGGRGTGYTQWIRVGSLNNEIKESNTEQGILFPVDFFKNIERSNLQEACQYLDNIGALNHIQRERIKEFLKLSNFQEIH